MEPETVPRRPLFLSIVVILLALSTASGLVTLLWRRDDFLRAFPAATPAILVGYLVTAIAILASLFGLWRLRPWGLALAVLLVVPALGLDILAEAPLAHRIAVVVSTLVVVAAAWPARRVLVPGRHPPAPPAD
ncbi:MAG: hypothetical protein U0X73_07805 [Thermoanaerobaculia bacterium]